MWDYGERCWTKVSSVWIFLRFSGLMGFRFPREYVRDGPGFFFSIIKTNWRYRFLHDCSPLVGRLLVAACCIAYITLIEVRFLLPTKSFFIVFFLLHFALVVWPFFFVLFAVPFLKKTKKQKTEFQNVRPLGRCDEI
jgi:FlaA1/EpsC-like NDP-sugar epimerase